MHLLTSLIIFLGFAFVVCFGLVKVIFDLSEMSVHVSPHSLATPHNRSDGPEEGHANANESSSITQLSDTQ
jgi:hypothetical protein